MPKHFSIRDQLETDAWQNHSRFAQGQARKQHPPVQRRSLKWQDRTLLILSALLLILLIIRVETARAEMQDEAFWGLEIQAGDVLERAVALDTDIEIEISGLVARIEVSQVFRNNGQGWAEAVYRYPLPEGAAVDRLRVETGGRVIEGEIHEKTEARRIYQQASNSGKLASLVEQQRANQFETRLANIGPGEDVRIFISFQARVDYRDGEFGLRMPLTFTPRWERNTTTSEASTIAAMSRSNIAPTIAAMGRSNDDHYLTIEVELLTGMKVASLESRYHDVDIHPSLQGYRLFLADPDARTDRVFELGWTPEMSGSPQSTLMTWDGGDDVYALLMLTPPLVEAIAPQSREVVFIVDTSGSMEGTSIEQARSALVMGLQFLGPDDRFNLIEFNSGTRLLFEESVPVYPAYLAQAEDFINGLAANGGTVMAPALSRAMSLPEQDSLLRQIVFITDGSVGNEHELLLQVGEQLRDSRLFTVSIGSAPNAWFMRKAAEIGRGSHTQIGKLDEVEERMASLWSRIEHPALQNICVDWGMEAEFYPEIVPDLYAGEPLWLYARLPNVPQEVTVCGDLDGRYWETSSRPVPGDGSESLASLWARSKIEALEDSRLFGTDPNHVRQEVVNLALEFGLLTRYTSLVAVDKTPSRPQAAGLESSDIPSLLPAGATNASGFSKTATGWPAQLALALMTLLGAIAALLFLPPSQERPGSGVRSPMVSSTR